jgi:hypothetical protein
MQIEKTYRLRTFVLVFDKYNMFGRTSLALAFRNDPSVLEGFDFVGIEVLRVLVIFQLARLH